LDLSSDEAVTRGWFELWPGGEALTAPEGPDQPLRIMIQAADLLNQYPDLAE
jgi:hypothetical protein